MPITILIVDDEAEMRRVMRGVMEMESDFSIIADIPGKQVTLDLIMETRPDAVVLNNLAPDKNQLHIAEQIRQYSPGTAIIMLCTYSDFADRQAARAAGVHAYFTEPVIDFDKLHETIREAYKSWQDSLSDR